MRTQPILQPLAPEHAEAIRLINEYAAAFCNLSAGFEDYLRGLEHSGIVDEVDADECLINLADSRSGATMIFTDLIGNIINLHYSDTRHESAK